MLSDNYRLKFFLHLSKNKLIFNFEKFVTKKRQDKNVFSLSFLVGSGMGKNQDPGSTSRIRNNGAHRYEISLSFGELSRSNSGRRLTRCSKGFPHSLQPAHISSLIAFTQILPEIKFRANAEHSPELHLDPIVFPPYTPTNSYVPIKLRKTLTPPRIRIQRENQCGSMRIRILIGVFFNT